MKRIQREERRSLESHTPCLRIVEDNTPVSRGVPKSSVRHSPAWLTIGATCTTGHGHPLFGTAGPDSAQRRIISRQDSLLRKFIPSPRAGPWRGVLSGKCPFLRSRYSRCPPKCRRLPHTASRPQGVLKPGLRVCSSPVIPESFCSAPPPVAPLMQADTHGRSLELGHV